MQQDSDNEQQVTKTKTTENQTQGVQTSSPGNEPQPARTAAPQQQEPPRVVQNEKQNEKYTQSPDAVRSTVTDTSTRSEPVWSATGVRIVVFILGIIEGFLALRLLLMLLAASTNSLFVRFIYGVSDVLILPFTGIFRDTVDTGMGTDSVFEPAILVAMLIYALVAWGFVKLIMIFRRKNSS